MFDRYNIGTSRGEVPAPITTALDAAKAILTGSLKHGYLRALWQISQHSGKLDRPMVLESILSFLADIRDMGHEPSVCKALIAAEVVLRRLDAGKIPDCASLMEISIARADSITACRRSA